MRKINIHTLLFLLLVSIVFCSYTLATEVGGIRQNIVDIANQLEKINRFDCEAVGINRAKPESYKLYEQLTTNATVKELIQLVEHDNAVVQCYSIKALSERASVDMLPILLSQLSNAKNVVSLCGSTQQTQKVCDFVYAQLQNLEKNEKIFVTTSLKDQIFQNILFNDYSDVIAYNRQLKGQSAGSNTTKPDKILANYKAYALNDVMLRVEPKPPYYNRIRLITEASICTNAIIALAKYRKQTDIQLLKQFYPDHHNHTTWLKAIYEFPDPGFLDDLFTLQLEYVDKQFCRANAVCGYYTVLLQYKNEQSIEIITYGLENMKYTKNRMCHMEALYAALELFPYSFYDIFKTTLPITEKQNNKIQAIIDDYVQEEE